MGRIPGEVMYYEGNDIYPKIIDVTVSYSYHDFAIANNLKQLVTGYCKAQNFTYTDKIIDLSRKSQIDPGQIKEGMLITYGVKFVRINFLVVSVKYFYCFDRNKINQCPTCRKIGPHILIKSLHPTTQKPAYAVYSP